MKLSGSNVGQILGAGVGTLVAPGVGTIIGSQLGAQAGGIADTFQKQELAKLNRTSSMFGGPRVRPQPKMVEPQIPMPGVPYLGAQNPTAAPEQMPTAGMMTPAATQGG